MPEVYLASAALKKEGFDGRRTVEEAITHGFVGVQLYLDPRYHEVPYRDEMVSKLQQSGLGVIIHLPNEVALADKSAAEDLAKKLPQARMLIHFLPTVEMPNIEGVIVGWENSIVRKLDEEQRGHMEVVKRQVRKDNTFFVFDVGRMMYLEDEEKGSQETLAYIREQIALLDPTRDILHLADKKGWTLNFRDSMCVLGDGLCGDLLEEIFAYKGIVVLEHENLQMAVDSLEVIRSNRKRA